MGYDVNKVIEIAKNEIGYLEKRNKDVNFLYDKTLNSGAANYTKFNKEMHDIYPAIMDYPAAWCDAFVDWCFYKAYGITNAKGLLYGNFNDYTVASAKLYKDKNAYYKKDPKIGDQIFFKNSKGGICHTGLVVNVDNKRVYTIEGNTSSQSGVVANGGCVAEKGYLLNYKYIDGYGRPKYEQNEEVKEVIKTTNLKDKSLIVKNIDYSAVVDHNFYSNTYLDLKNAFGTNKTKLFNHFLTYGIKEGRGASLEFNVLVYKNNYKDLQNAFGNDLYKYYIHYIQ